MSFEQIITRAWYQDQKWIRVLTPLSKVYQLGLNRRRKRACAEARSLSVPVVVVGNITVGGTGKTPLIIELCRKLSEAGISIGVVSRGYGAQTNQYPYEVSSSDTAAEVGDEPLMICQQTSAVVVIDPDRYAAARHLIDLHKVDIILSDDGMQHFGLPRDLEILVVDGMRELGNERLIPAGPLREPVERLNQVDFCLINGTRTEIKSSLLKQSFSGRFSLQAKSWVHVATNKRTSLEQFRPAGKLYALAGIGNPQRFFNTLESLGVDAECRVLDDHQAVSEALLLSLSTKGRHSNISETDSENNSAQILMTMKDAVKCRDFATDNCWALDVGLVMEPQLENKILDSIKALTSKHNQRNWS